ncbi:hypothetical protein TcasGA2_TC033155 [Tribolium castaneum]|uniref:Uncharacterized protein n=1 Tax=Tribolium castaneum TaxID=7070 RepID=A0A139WH75_TRICA|nr:PREDICTED: uncharacterized protein LOC103313140 [Tribolium castaneum]KYB27234.1 hypothetical protein TcasGA2_TC033155 [Tribolium castaneum]|eukprot:XP_008193835.1 PREDICTED: uncharacterized protein LOC103313140 [Tribolium castaneum]
MKNAPHKHPKTVPIRRRHGEGSSSSVASSDIEGTFIPLTESDSKWEGLNFLNRNFKEEEEQEDVVKIVDLQTEEKPPLFLLFPDLGNKDKERLSRETSTTQITQILVGKRADFSLLKPSKKINPEQSKLPPLHEATHENSDSEGSIK